MKADEIAAAELDEVERLDRSLHDSAPGAADFARRNGAVDRLAEIAPRLARALRAAIGDPESYAYQQGLARGRREAIEEAAELRAVAEGHRQKCLDSCGCSVCEWLRKAETRTVKACSRCNGGGLLQNAADGWRPGLVLTREAEACVRAVFAGQAPPVCETKWQTCPACGGGQ